MDEFAATNLLHCSRHHIKQSLEFLFFKNCLIGTSPYPSTSHSSSPQSRCVNKVTGTYDMCDLGKILVNPLNPKLNPTCYLLALLGAHHFLHVSRIRVKLLTFRRLMSYIYGEPILDVSRSHTTTQHSR